MKSLTIALVLTALAISWCGRSEAAAPNFDVEKFAAIVPGMQKFVDDQEICGGVMMIGTADGVAYLDAVGHRTLDSDQPMPKDAIFRIMSMTKPMTALGLMMLVDEGKASIDDRIEKYLPEFKSQMLTASADKEAGTVTLKKPSRPITIKDLLTHTGGLPEYPEGLKGLMRKRDHTLAEMEMISSQRPLDFEPGSKWKYSSSGIDVLGRLIEVFSGQAYEDFLAERIFKPLAMQDTGFYVSPQQAERLAELCGQKDSKLVAAKTLPNSMEAEPTVKPKYPSPAGGLYSTATDLSRLYRTLLHGGELDDKRIIAAETLKKMTTIQTGDLQCSFTPGMSCGLGFHIVREPQGITQMLSPGTYGHGGAFGTQAWIDPEKGVFYVLLIQRVGLKNSDASDMRKEFQTLAAQALTSTAKEP
ncbi:MAG TPA: serine hydrolase domain-containing protein [Pirellulales bacterium]